MSAPADARMGRSLRLIFLGEAMNPVLRLVTAALASGALCACAARPIRPEEPGQPILHARVCFVGVNESAKNRPAAERYARRIWKQLWHAYQADHRDFSPPVV